MEHSARDLRTGPIRASEMKVVLPPAQWHADRLNRGDELAVINPFGSQVVDTWAFAVRDPNEFMSMEHSRLHFGRLQPTVGDTFVSNRHNPMLTLVADTSAGEHDTLLPACDSRRYELLGVRAYHPNCRDNLMLAMRELGISISVEPSPLNLFEHVALYPTGRLEIAAPTSQPGATVTFRTERDVFVVLSACPQDLLATNGSDCIPRGVEVLFSNAAVDRPTS